MDDCRLKEYKKPIVMINDELSEGVYTASGDTCYTVNTTTHQDTLESRPDYRINLNAVHSAINGHHSGKQTLVITFNHPVSYVSSNGLLAYGDNSSILTIDFSYHNNANDNIGMGDLIVKSEIGLEVLSAVLHCNGDCGIH